MTAWMRLPLAALVVVALFLATTRLPAPAAIDRNPSAPPGVRARADSLADDEYLDRVLEDYVLTKHSRYNILISNHPSTEGLGSRMTGFLSAFYLALAMNFSLATHWSVRSRLVESKQAAMIALDNLFVTNHSLVPLERYSPNRTSFLGYAGARHLRQLRREMDYWGCTDFIADLRDVRRFKFTTTVWMLPLIRHNPSVQHYEFIRRTATYRGLYRKLAAFLLRPASAVLAQAQQLAATLMPGVNICAHSRAQMGDSDRDTEACLSKLVNASTMENKASRIYLATDNEVFRQKMKRKYQEQLVTSAKKVVRNTDGAVIDAIVEMQLLRHCRGRVIYAPHSTFSIFAFAATGQPAYNAHTCEVVELFEPCFRLWHWMNGCPCHHDRPWKLAWSGKGYGLVECINEIL